MSLLPEIKTDINEGRKDMQIMLSKLPDLALN
jgi:hypothetical protein